MTDLRHDGLHMPPIKMHSLDKHRRHNYLTCQFATSMQKKWPQRAYIGLYAGAGRAIVENTGEIVETPGLTVLRQPFTHYIFVDNDPACVDALEKRAAVVAPQHTPQFILGDVNEKLDDIRAALPPFGTGNGLLSFCFVDPFNAALKFRTVRSLAKYQMDFLILLALGHDVVRNFWKHYYRDRSNTRIADLLDRPNWRAEFEASGEHSVIRFILRMFDEAMIGAGYLPPKPEHHCAVKSNGRLLYYLVLYSKHPLGLTFWENTQAGVSGQLELGLHR